MPKLGNLPVGERVESPVSGRGYTIEALLGEGGFGAAYRARIGRRRDRVCIKLTFDQSGWHREAYLGELLAGHDRVVDIHDTFPIVMDGEMAYAVVMELAEGTLSDAVERDGPWSERKAIREIRGLLTAVDRLHRSGALHRDITPLNVFVCDGRLKLGDFGICQHSFGGGVAADAFAPWFVDPDINDESRVRWTIGDDLWQVAQLLVGMIRGDAWPIHKRDIRGLACSDLLKRVLYRALGVAGDRYPDAESMSEAFDRTQPTFARLRSLAGRTIAFTGPMSVPRSDAERWSRLAGATVARGVSRKVDTLVVGSRSPNWLAGSEGGTKLLKVAALAEKGHTIKLVRESTFLKLVADVRGG